MNETKAVLYSRGICINTDAGLPRESPDSIFRLVAEYFGVHTVYVLDCETKMVYTYSRESSIALDELVRLREIDVYTDGRFMTALIDIDQLNTIVNAIDNKNDIYVKYPINKTTGCAEYNTYEVYGYKLHNEYGFVSLIYTRKCTCEKDDAIELFKCHWRVAR